MVFGQFGQDMYKAASKIASNLKPGEELTDALVNKAKKIAYSDGVSQASKILYEDVKTQAENLGIKNGRVFKNYDDLLHAASGITKENFDDRARTMEKVFKKASITPEQSQSMINQFKAGLENNTSGIDDDIARITKENVSDFFLKKQHGMTPDAPYTMSGMAQYAKETAGAYFNPGSTDELKKMGKTRRRTAGIGYVAGNLGLRYARGGTITQDPYGERDIAGVPFI